jgi:hypothetical protein
MSSSDSDDSDTSPTKTIICETVCFGGCRNVVRMTNISCPSEEFGNSENRRRVNLGEYVLVTSCGCKLPICSECSFLVSIHCVFCGENTTVSAMDKECSSFYIRRDRYHERKSFWPCRPEKIVSWFRSVTRFNRVRRILGDIDHSSFFKWLKQTTDKFPFWVDIDIDTLPDDEIRRLLHSYEQLSP